MQAIARHQRMVKEEIHKYDVPMDANISRLPVELAHRILDDVPKRFRSKVFRMLKPRAFFTECVRTHPVHGEGMEVLEEEDIESLAKVSQITFDLRLHSGLVKKLPTDEFPPISGRLWLFLNRGLLPVPPRNLFSIKCYHGDYSHTHRHGEKYVPQWHCDYGRGVESPYVTLELHVPYNYNTGRVPRHLPYYEAKANEFCRRESATWRATVTLARSMYSAIQAVKTSQLDRLAKLVDEYGYMLRSAIDPERSIRANTKHLSQRLCSRATTCRGYQHLDYRKKQVSPKTAASLFRGPSLPVVPVDMYLNFVLQTLATGLLNGLPWSTGGKTDKDFLDGGLQRSWDELVARCDSQERAVEVLYGSELSNEPTSEAGVTSTQICKAIDTFLQGLNYIFDYKRPETLPRIELAGTDKGKSKEQADDQAYLKARQRFKKPQSGVRINLLTSCTSGPHILIRHFEPFAFDHPSKSEETPKQAIPDQQIIDYMSIESTHPVPGDDLNAPLDNREIEWLEAFLRLAKFFLESWYWEKNHEGECNIPGTELLMTRADGIRRHAWVLSLETGRAMESPEVAAQQILKRTGRGTNLPGTRPWYL